MTALSPLNGGHNGQAYWINNEGQVVGFAENGTADATCATATPFQQLRFEAVIWGQDGKAPGTASAGWRHSRVRLWD